MRCISITITVYLSWSIKNIEKIPDYETPRVWCTITTTNSGSTKRWQSKLWTQPNRMSLDAGKRVKMGSVQYLALSSSWRASPQAVTSKHSMTLHCTPRASQKSGSGDISETGNGASHSSSSLPGDSRCNGRWSNDDHDDLCYSGGLIQRSDFWF